MFDLSDFRLNPIYSEAEDTGAGRSKASSSGYGSQRGSGGGSVSDRPPPSIPQAGSKELPIWHNDGSEDPYTIYSTYSVRDESGSERYNGAKKFDDLLTKQGRYLPKVTRGYPKKAEYFAKVNEAFVDEGIKEVAESEGYVSKSEVESAVVQNEKKDVVEYDSLQADPFLLYSQFIKQEEEKAEGVSLPQVEVEEEVVHQVNSEGASLSVAREDYLRSLLQDVAVALEEALASRRLEPQGGLLREARERVALGLVALRRAGPQDLRQLSRALSRGPPRPLPRPAPPAPPSPHARKPSLWQQYYARANSTHSGDSGSVCYVSYFYFFLYFTC